MVLPGRRNSDILYHRTEYHIQHWAALKVFKGNIVFCGSLHCLHLLSLILSKEFTEEARSKHFPHRRMVEIPAVGAFPQSHLH